MPGETNQQNEIKERGAIALRDLARLLARQAAAEAVNAIKSAGPAPSSPDQLDEDSSHGTTIRKPADH